MIYWLIFQPTRKLAQAIIKTLAEKAQLTPVLDMAEEVVAQANEVEKAKSDLPKKANDDVSDNAEKSLQELVEAIKKNNIKPS